MAIPDPGKGPNTLPRVGPNLIQPWSTLINQFGAARPTYGHKRAIYGLLSHFGTLWRPRWPFQTRERVPTHRPGCARTWSNLDPRWSTSLESPGLLMAQQSHLWPFWAILGPYGGLNSEKIHKIRTATCSTITCKTKKNNEIVQEVKLRKWLNSKVAGLISTLWSWSPTQFDHTHPIKGQSYHRYHLSLWRESC